MFHFLPLLDPAVKSHSDHDIRVGIKMAMTSQTKNHHFEIGSNTCKTDFKELHGFNEQLWKLANNLTDINRITFKFGMPERFLNM